MAEIKSRHGGGGGGGGAERGEIREGGAWLK